MNELHCVDEIAGTERNVKPSGEIAFRSRISFRVKRSGHARFGPSGPDG
jgi:hypothetical protein